MPTERTATARPRRSRRAFDLEAGSRNRGFSCGNRPERAPGGGHPLRVRLPTPSRTRPGSDGAPGSAQSRTSPPWRRRGGADGAGGGHPPPTATLARRSSGHRTSDRRHQIRRGTRHHECQPGSRDGWTSVLSIRHRHALRESQRRREALLDARLPGRHRRRLHRPLRPGHGHASNEGGTPAGKRRANGSLHISTDSVFESQTGQVRAGTAHG